ncbi:uncharacterized protein LOC134838238 [Culicoides brevitarsis]|uniref:uncharacterized protein LOC134838238 n=1 Tax=Culicoides brevitarsis TaxID=469753 RepID=UPI00307C7427
MEDKKHKTKHGVEHCHKEPHSSEEIESHEKHDPDSPNGSHEHNHPKHEHKKHRECLERESKSDCKDVKDKHDQKSKKMEKGGENEQKVKQCHTVTVESARVEIEKQVVEFKKCCGVIV